MLLYKGAGRHEADNAAQTCVLWNSCNQGLYIVTTLRNRAPGGLANIGYYAVVQRQVKYPPDNLMNIESHIHFSSMF